MGQAGSVDDAYEPVSSPLSPAVARLRAPAKLTVSLRVVGVRDDGYHLIDAEMVTVDLFDELFVAPGDRLDVVDEVVGGIGCPTVSAGPENLVSRALRAIGRQAAVRLVKRVPAGAGLGGGSADAAAILRWAGVNDPSVALTLGADVPFCLVGGRARVRGVGEEIERLDSEARSYVLLLPPVGIDTAACYRAWDELGTTGSEGDNDLEEAAVRLEPALARWRDTLGAVCGQRPRMAGSGSTWFVEGEPEELGLTGVRTLVCDGAAATLVPVRTVGPDGKVLVSR